MLPDDQPLLTLEREQLREGVYRMLDDKLKERIRLAYIFHSDVQRDY